jgi:hypothetical protein
MKNILILIFVSLSFTIFSQTKKPIDTTQMCIPYDVVQKMLLDLNDYDKLKELSKLDKKEISELNNKIIFLEKTTDTWQQKDSLSNEIIKSNEEKFKIVESENKDLKKDIKKLKTKNVIVEIVSGSLVSALTYLLVLKQ